MKKLFTPFILPLLVFFLSCSSDEPQTPNEPETPIIKEKKTKLTYSKSISETPFIKPHEAIVHNNKLYVVDDLKTFSYDFNSKEWLTINDINTDNFETIANYPYLEYNVGFIRNNKWYVLRYKKIYSFDFTTNQWTEEKSFSDAFSKLYAPIGVYENNRLFVFSDLGSVIYEYNFENKELIKHGKLEAHGNTGQLVKSIFKINNEYYYTKVSHYKGLKIFKFTEDFKQLEFLNEYDNTNYIAQGSGFIFGDKIIFGLGGEASADSNGNITSTSQNDKFYYYDTKEDAFGEVENTFYEKRYVALPIQHNNKYYLLGGKNITGNIQNYRNTLDELKFEIIEE